MSKESELFLKLLKEYKRDKMINKDKMTNRDRINNMTNEEFAKFINSPLTECKCCITYYSEENLYCNNCEKGIVEWLESEVEE